MSARISSSFLVGRSHRFSHIAVVTGWRTTRHRRRCFFNGEAPRIVTRGVGKASASPLGRAGVRLPGARRVAPPGARPLRRVTPTALPWGSRKFRALGRGPQSTSSPSCRGWRTSSLASERAHYAFGPGSCRKGETKDRPRASGPQKRSFWPIGQRLDALSQFHAGRRHGWPDPRARSRRMCLPGRSILAGPKAMAGELGKRLSVVCCCQPSRGFRAANPGVVAATGRQLGSGACPQRWVGAVPPAR